MRKLFYIARYVLAIYLCAPMACGGQQIEPLDPRDQSLPQETRRWIAAAEDGVVVARARRDAVQTQRNRSLRQQKKTLDQVDFGSRGTRVIDALEERYERLDAYMAVQLERAEGELALAQAKYELATAEQAILHDLARYDLEELKQKVEAARRRVGSSQDLLRKTRDALDRATSAFWQAYSQYLKEGGETLPFWIGKGSQVTLTNAETHSTSKSETPTANPRSNVERKDLPTNPF
jgi:hypothetical protein